MANTERRIFMQTTSITVSPYIILAVFLFVVVVVAGVMIVTYVVGHKWGYTPEREQELQERIENDTTQRSERSRKNRKKRD